MSLWRRATGLRWWTGGLILLAVVAGLAGWWEGDRSEDPHWFAGAADSVATGEPAQPAGPAPSAGPAANATGKQQAGSAVSAPPYVQPFAQQPGATPHRRQPRPTAGVEIAEGADGCDHAYGDPSVCVPWQFPTGVTDKCGWLKTHGFKPLKITGGRDRHGLDSNDDGTACGTGD